MLIWLLLFSLFNVSHFSIGEGRSIITNEDTPRVPALYVFGDSLSDIGNSLPFFYLPYGVNFSAGQGTGRFSNGKLFVDFVAEYLGLPYPPAYKLNSFRPSKIGFNYAYAGCGILPEPGTEGGCWTIGDQLVRFRKTVEEDLPKLFGSPDKVSEHLANSLFTVWMGSNDYILSYFEDKVPEYNPDEFAQILVDTLSEQIKALYELGARKVLVMELGPIGCTPKFRGDHDETWCDETKNDIVKLFNKKLESMMATLVPTLPDAYFSLGKIYDVSDDAFNNPGKYGLTTVGKACCTLAGDLICMPWLFGYRPPLAGNPDGFLFWDGAHPTEASNSIIATQCISGTSVCVPMNIEELIQVVAKPAASSLKAIM